MASVICRYGFECLLTLAESDFLDNVKHYMGGLWIDQLRNPAITYFEWCKQNFKKQKTHGIIEFFENVKLQMLQAWEIEIVQSSTGFMKAKVQ